MLGLLYKDYLAVKGKLYLAFLIALVGIIFGIRIIATGEENDVMILALCIKKGIYYVKKC